MALRSYQELVAWKKSMALVSDTYRCTQGRRNLWTNESDSESRSFSSK